MSIRRRPAPTEPPTTDREAPDDMQQHAVSDEDEENEAANAEGKEKRGPSMASRVLPNLIPRIQTKRLPSKPASETKPPETPEST